MTEVTEVTVIVSTEWVPSQCVVDIEGLNKIHSFYPDFVPKWYIDSLLSTSRAAVEILHRDLKAAIGRGSRLAKRQGLAPATAPHKLVP